MKIIRLYLKDGNGLSRACGRGLLCSDWLEVAEESADLGKLLPDWFMVSVTAFRSD